LHDSIMAERQGVPAVGVMTTRFVSAATLMAKVLGMPGYPFSVIEHPISNAGDAGLEARARATVAELEALLLRKA
jgi:hypothetical protein